MFLVHLKGFMLVMLVAYLLPDNLDFLADLFFHDPDPIN